MSARVERYRIEEREDSVPPSPGPVIRLPTSTPGPHVPVPDVSDSLLAHLQKQFPNTVPERTRMTADEALIALGVAWGKREVMAYLETLNQEQQGQ